MRTSLRRAAAPAVQTREGSLFQSQHFYRNNVVAQLSNKPAYPISLKQMVLFGQNINDDKLLKSANFVRQELPVRIAHRIRDLQNLPFVVGLNPNLEGVYSSYLDAFERVRRFAPIRTIDDNDRFCEFLSTLLASHWATVPRMMTGLLESAAHLPAAPRERFMNRMLRSRISRRVLAEHHIALSRQYHDSLKAGSAANVQQRFIGVVDTALSPYESIKALEQHLPSVTGIQTEIVVDNTAQAKKVKFAFIDDHLRFVVFELIKNGVLAAVRNGREDRASRVHVSIAESAKSVGVRVSDAAGGISLDPQPRTELHDAPIPTSASRSSQLHFSHPRMLAHLPVLRQTTRLGGTIDEQIAEDSVERLGEPGKRVSQGMGLGLARVYAEYFGGSLQLYTMDGLGSDAYLTVPKMSAQRETAT